MNDIPERLAQESFFRLWAASNHLYTRAKRILKVQMVLVVLAPVGLAFALLACSDLKPWVGLYSVLVSAGDAVIPYYLLKRLKETAARIQEKFDCDLLEMEWHERRVGKEVPEETISDAFRKAGQDAISRKRVSEWYPVLVGKVPLSVARILCQRGNVVWDAGLRSRYTGGVLAVLVALGAVVLVAGFWRRLDVRDVVLSVLSPALPLFLWLIREYIRQNESADTVEKIRNDSEALWDRVMKENPSEEVLEVESRHLQDRIYDHRRTNTPILDIFYSFCRTNQEGTMVDATDVMVKRYLETYSSGQTD